MFSCSRQIELQKSEFLLGELSFQGNDKVHFEELENLIPIDEKPNNKPLNLPWIQFTPRVWIYNFGLNSFDENKHKNKLNNARLQLSKYPEGFSRDIKTERLKQKFKRRTTKFEENLAAKNGWIWRNLGEPQAIMSFDKAEVTAGKIQKYLKDIGYRDAVVTYEIDSLITTEKLKLVYKVNEGTGYVIDTVQFEISDPTLDSIIYDHRKEALIASGDLFDIRKVNAEKNRIETLAKTNGYYNFVNQYIQHQAYNASGDPKKFQEDKSGNLRFRILNPPNQSKHQQYYLRNITFKGFDPYADALDEKSDTLSIDGIRYIIINSSIPAKRLDKKVITRPGELYDVNKIAETQRQISQLNQFSFASSQLNVVNEDQLSLEYFAPLLTKYSFNTGPGLNYIINGGSGFLGFGVPVTLTARNWFKRLELFEASGRIFREGQPSPLGTTDLRGSWELGTNASVTFPSISFLGRDIKKLNHMNPRTQLLGGFNYSEPFWGNRLNTRINANYRWQPNRYTTAFFSLVDANLVSTNYNLRDPNGPGAQFYNSLVEQQEKGNNLKTTFDPQFVSSINGSYVYNDQNLQEPYSSSQFLRIFVESGGTILNFAKDKNNMAIIEKLFPLRQDLNSPDTARKYFRFVKVNIDYRRYINLSINSSFAYRFNVGVANPYGNKSLPYEKNFFVGGSNSIRAWSPRALGIGSAVPDTAAGNVIPQVGDILIEGSFEWRKKIARFFGDIQFATFIDYGNIWKWYPVNTPEKINKVNFSLDRFYKEIAVGTGFGFRYDLSYFQFRFDWGIKVVDPSRDPGERFVLDEFKFGRNRTIENISVPNPYRLNFNLGIGYPF